MIKNSKIEFKSQEGFEFRDITDEVQEFIEETKIKNGNVLVFSTHTTLAICINEKEKGIVKLNFTQFPVKGITTTYDAGSFITDSASAGTAIAHQFYEKQTPGSFTQPSYQTFQASIWGPDYALERDLYDKVWDE
jgi:alkaline phosphatase